MSYPPKTMRTAYIKAIDINNTNIFCGDSRHTLDFAQAHIDG